ncbi:MAG: efflux RND transporter permease subunit [Bacteroidales bacterium]|nr:efflux RND transporter permease subunit [Lachnoclostridium sp.]MCM1384552.1 efflux RND transporter permease subunit [Lachnoclostridium sp.]MCM1465166.1 efflux RND transporter permease subunit [Bacteroidales bacterium]
MNLTKLALKRPVSCFLMILALAVFSISSLFGFRLELTPDIEMPMLIVMATYPGADPESVDKLVATKIEDAGASLSGVDSVTTMSSENYCLVLFTYDYGVDIAECHNDLRAALEVAALGFPEDASDPTIIEMNMNSVPVLAISVIEVGDVDLLKVVNESVVPELESLAGVAQVSVSGGSEEYIKIELDETMLRQYGLTMSSVAQFLGAVDFTYPAGSVQQGSQDISVATSMEYNTVQKLKEVPLMTATGSVIMLQDVAEVTLSSKDADSMSRYNGKDNVSISIQNKSSFGTVNVCNDVVKELEKIQKENPAITFDITYNASDSIVDSLSSVAQTLALGVVFTMLVLFVFFGDFKASLIVGASMPISLFLTLILMSFMGFSMNIVTLGSLVIAIGMMVDASIVVIESCFRKKEKKLDFKEAAFEGTKEVTASIIASTITTIVVYLPLATMKGLSGQIFSQLGFTIVFAMLASLIAAMMLVPLFYCVFKPTPKENLPIDKLLAKIHAGYRKLLRKILHKRALAVIVAVALVAVALMMAGTLDMELMPSADEGMVQVAINFRSGTTLETENEAIEKWEQIASEDENVSGYSVSVGSGSSVMSTGGGSANLTANLKKDRKLSTAQVVDKWNEIAASMTNMDITVSATGSSMSSMMSTGSYEVDLQGDNMEELKQAAADLQTELSKVDGVIKTDNSMANASTMARVQVDPLKAMQYGLTPIQVAMTLNNVLSGVSPLTIAREGSEYEVRLEYPKGIYDDLNQLMDLGLSTSFGVTVPLRDIAEIVYVDSQETITKQDGLYLVSLTATLTSDKIFEAQSAIEEVVAQTVFPESVTPAESMMVEMMYEEFASLFQAILTAVFLVFLVMAMQFESPRFSIMVMLCIPFSLIGSFFLLFITGSTFSMISLMGFLMLIGIVVNNGILFVDSTNMLKQEMSVEDALIETGIIRLRPILMTTLTTILSMVPMGMAIGGGNAIMMQGMALVIIGGLIASTALTLILIPTFYLILDKEERRKRKEQKRMRKMQS